MNNLNNGQHTAHNSQGKSRKVEQINPRHQEYSDSELSISYVYSRVNDNQYYSKALSSPLGQKVLSFYTTTSKQVLDIHEEARRLAQEQKAAQWKLTDLQSTDNVTVYFLVS